MRYAAAHIRWRASWRPKASGWIAAVASHHRERTTFRVPSRRARVAAASPMQSAHRARRDRSSPAGSGRCVMVTVDLLVRLVAKPGKEEELERFLESGVEMVRRE